MEDSVDASVERRRSSKETADLKRLQGRIDSALAASWVSNRAVNGRFFSSLRRTSRAIGGVYYGLDCHWYASLIPSFSRTLKAA